MSPPFSFQFNKNSQSFRFEKSWHVCLQIIENNINPFVDAREEQGAFPAHELFKKLGEAGFLGVNKPTGE